MKNTNLVWGTVMSRPLLLSLVYLYESECKLFIWSKAVFLYLQIRFGCIIIVFI